MDQAREFLTQYSGTTSYVIFYFILLGCSIGLPWNSDITIIAASVLAAVGFFKLPFLIPIAFLGLLTGDSINFFVARKYGPKILSVKPFRWVLTPQKVKNAERYLNEQGNKFLFIIRFLPLIRTALFFAAGSLQVKPRTFYIFNCLATLIYLPVLMNAAYYTSENIDQVIAFLKNFQLALLSIFTVVMVYVIFRKKSKRPAHS